MSIWKARDTVEQETVADLRRRLDRAEERVYARRHRSVASVAKPSAGAARELTRGLEGMAGEALGRLTKKNASPTCLLT